MQVRVVVPTFENTHTLNTPTHTHTHTHTHNPTNVSKKVKISAQLSCLGELLRLLPVSVGQCGLDVKGIDDDKL